MQQRNINDILKDLTAAKKRIDKQKNELTKELRKLETEAAGQGEKPKAEAFSIAAIYNGTQTAAEIDRKIASIKAALDLPYYADSEYRQLSIAYMEAVTANYAADLAQNEASIKAAENAVAAANENLAKAREHTEDIKAAVIDKINGVGLGGVIPEAVHCPPDHLISKYKDLCSKYD